MRLHFLTLSGEVGGDFASDLESLTLLFGAEIWELVIGTIGKSPRPGWIGAIRAGMELQDTTDHKLRSPQAVMWKSYALGVKDDA